MALKCALALVVIGTSMLVNIVMANRNWNSTYPPNWNNTNNYFWGYWHRNAHRGPNKVIVGGPENSWRFGFNYTDWAIKKGPFFMNDVLVFKYDPPNDTTFPHSVYLLPDFQSFQNCDLSKARKIGEVNGGSGQGFEFALKWWRPYYFACGEHDGIHCKTGLMKFSVWPLIRWYY